MINKIGGNPAIIMDLGNFTEIRGVGLFDPATYIKYRELGDLTV